MIASRIYTLVQHTMVTRSILTYKHRYILQTTMKQGWWRPKHVALAG